MKKRTACATSEAAVSLWLFCLLPSAVGCAGAGSASPPDATGALGAPISLFTTQTPALLHESDGANVNYELGMRWQSSAAGQLTAIRFWKDSFETGTHTGHVWSAAGALLASVTFANETGSGWQQQALATSLSITANTRYTVSVNTGNTYYVDTINGLGSRITHGSLSSVVGNNGTFGPPGQYPTNSWNASNYFRDLVFVAGSASGPLLNGGFESGLTGWTPSGPAVTTPMGAARSGRFGVQLGGTDPTAGDSSVSQSFTAPGTGGTLSFYYKMTCPDTVQYDWATATLRDDSAGTTATLLAPTCTTSGAWAQVATTLVAGRSYTLTLASHDDDAAGDASYTYFDDVVISTATSPPDMAAGGCTPATCAALGKSCGAVADGCGGTLDCGGCIAPQTCGGGGVANVCGGGGGGGAIVPADRMISWIPGVTVGVPGGIPNRTTLCATINAATYGTGSVDASSAIGAAIDSCPAGQVVYIPAGTYRFDSRIYRASASNVTIRGAGMGRTVLRANGSGEMLHFGTSDWPRPSGGVSITAGANQGSSTLTVSSASSFAVGKLVRVEQDDLPYVIDAANPTTNTRALSSIHRVTAVSASTVTITPPLPFTFTARPTMVQYSAGPLVGLGVEDLTLDGNGQSGIPLYIEASWGSWVKNVEIENSTSRQMLLYGFSAGEIRHNYTHSVTGGGPNHEGIDFYQDGSFNLIEDNIVYNGGFPGIILGDSKGGCAGNVIAYNFAYDPNVGDPGMSGADVSVSHGAHNIMNLVEGNLAGQFQADGYWGSTSHITVLRNWFTATHPTATTNLMAVSIERWQNYFSLVGNILGTSAFAGGYQPVMASLANQDIYKLGFPNMGNGSWNGSIGPTNPPNYAGQSATGKGLQEFDLNVAATMIRHGNYDYYNKSIQWDPAIPNHSLPSSYFRSSKPAFFGALAWPPFDPVSPPGAFNNANLSKIPAGYRFVNGVDP